MTAARLLCDEPLKGDGIPWNIRAVEVRASPEDWLDVGSGIKVSRWITHFTWHPGDVEFLTPEEAEKILGRDAIEPHPD